MVACCHLVILPQRAGVQAHPRSHRCTLAWMWLCAGCDDSDSDCDEVRFRGEIPLPPAYRLLDAAVADQKVAFVPHLLAAKDISRIHSAVHKEDVKIINDRDELLVYRHEVWRPVPEFPLQFNINPLPTRVTPKLPKPWALP